MTRITYKKQLNVNTTLLELDSPLIARKILPGQFIMLRIDEKGERIPLTVADSDTEKGTITIIFQAIGKTTMQLAALDEGDNILDLAGPLGMATPLEGYKRVAVIGGGLGTAIAYPQVKKLVDIGAVVDSIAGFRNKDLIILEDELRVLTKESTYITTDDGSNRTKGFVTEILQKRIDEGANYDLVIAIGPVSMMRAVAEVTRKAEIRTIVSLSPLMIDGTGMCGGCRVRIDNEIKFACIEGPDFDGHLVDYDELMLRQNMFKKEENISRDIHVCRLGGAENE